LFNSGFVLQLTLVSRYLVLEEMHKLNQWKVAGTLKLDQAIPWIGSVC
jgi:hypothetical protein